MDSTTPTWMDSAARRLRDLAARPVLLFALLLAVNSLARPYANFAHDARLYSVQVLSQIEPDFRDDLFLKYGSQDQFSLFSRCVAPLVSVFGLHATFFGLYLLFNGLLIYAMQRLVLALIQDRFLAVLALLYMVTAPLSFGGLGIFKVHEPFLTPRILANALVLFGLEKLLARRYALSLLLMLASACMHPLMAQAGLVIWLVVVAWDGLPRPAFFGLLVIGMLTAAAVLLHQPWGLKLFGQMDDDWREIVRLASAYNFPDEWTARDWLNVVLSLSVVVASACLLRKEDSDKARLLGITAFVGIAGLAGTVLGSITPYAFLFQAQPYRVLWVVKALQVPLTFWLAVRLWPDPRLLPRLAVAFLVGSLWITGEQWLELCLPLFFLPILIVRFRGLDSEPRTSDWFTRSAVYSLVMGAVGWSLYKVVIIFANRDSLRDLLDPLDIARLMIDNIGPMLWIVIALAAIGMLMRLTRPAVTVALGLALIVQIAFFALPYVPAYRNHATRYEADLARLADFLNETHAGQTRPTIYCALGRIDYLWIDLKARSYFDWAQIVGCLFNRANAEEGRRRALVVRAFEVDRIQEGLTFLSESRRRTMEGLFQADLDTLKPSRADLEKLCLNEDLDYVILKQEYPGLATASFGRLHLYDCRQLRLALKGPATSVMAGSFSDARPSVRPLLPLWTAGQDAGASQAFLTREETLP